MTEAGVHSQGFDAEHLTLRSWYCTHWSIPLTCQEAEGEYLAHPQSRVKILWQECRASGSEPAFGCHLQEPGASAGWVLATRGECATHWQWLGVGDQVGAES